MAKLSVYVPDDLLAEAKRGDDLNVSQVLQTALRERIERPDRPYARLSPELESRQRLVQEAVVSRIASAYQAGYRVGLALALDLPWEAFEDLARVGWKLQPWWEDFNDREYLWARADDEDRAEGTIYLDRDHALG